MAPSAVGVHHARGACCYFSAKDKDVNQPAQKAFITWDAKENVESFTVQPKFEGNAQDFGMVIPTPAKPRLDEMPRDFFKELAVFTILEPMDLSKYKQMRYLFAARTGVVQDKCRPQVHREGPRGRGSSARWTTRSSPPSGPTTCTSG